MVVGGLLLVLAYLRLAGPFSGVIALVGLALLGFGFLTWLLRPRRSDAYWRGRRVDLGDLASSWWVRLYRAIYRDS